MKILLHSRHRFPAGGHVGTGLRSNPRTTGGAAFVHDHLARGLAELGHEVSYHAAAGYDPPLPAGVRFVELPVHDVDLLHNSNSQFLHVDWPARDLANLGAPWLSTCHVAASSAGSAPGHCRGGMPSNWVVVSETLARAYGHGRCVPNGVDPDALIFSSAKESYFLFSSRAEVADDKGLTLALVLSRTLGFPLTVMGASTSDEAMEDVAARCRNSGARFVGDARGQRKAELFAGARALLFPTTLNEGCPLVIAEALMSGTPVIASPRGPCPEMVTPDVGFVCEGWEDYVRAVNNVGSIRPEDCRNRAFAKYHYLEMARGYVAEYLAERERYESDPAGYFEMSARLILPEGSPSPQGALRSKSVPSCTSTRSLSQDPSRSFRCPNPSL